MRSCNCKEEELVQSRQDVEVTLQKHSWKEAMKAPQEEPPNALEMRREGATSTC